MQIPLKIIFKNMGHSDAVTGAVNKWVAKMGRTAGNIISCRVTVEAPTENKRHGGSYQTTVNIKLPCGEVITNRQPDEHHSYTDVYVSIRDAFKNAQRKLEGLVKQRQGQIKTHESVPYGRIKYLDLISDYGTIETPDGEDIYFHRNSMLYTKFEKLSIGTEVRFVIKEDSDGLHAGSVRLFGKQRPASMPGGTYLHSFT